MLKVVLNTEQGQDFLHLETGILILHFRCFWYEEVMQICLVKEKLFKKKSTNAEKESNFFTNDCASCVKLFKTDMSSVSSTERGFIEM